MSLLPTPQQVQQAQSLQNEVKEYNDAAIQLLINFWLKTKNDKDQFDVAMDKLQKSLRTDESYVVNGEVRYNYKPLSEQHYILSEALTGYTVEDIETLARQRRQSRERTMLQSGTYEERQSFQSDALDRPDYANADTYAYNTLQERYNEQQDELENKIDADMAERIKANPSREKIYLKQAAAKKANTVKSMESTALAMDALAPLG